MKDAESPIIFSVWVHADGISTVDCPGLSGDELLDAAASAIAAIVGSVEATWTMAHGKKSGINAGQCAINRAGNILNKGGHEIVDGKLDVRT